MIGGLGTVLAWRIALGSLRGRVAAAWPVACSSPLRSCVLGIYCIVPNPEYDCDCGFWILAARLDVAAARCRRPALGSALPPERRFACRSSSSKTWACQFCWWPSARFSFARAQRPPQPAKSARSAQPAHAVLRPGRRVHNACGSPACAPLRGWHRQLPPLDIEYAGRRRLPGFSLMLGVYRDPIALWTLPCVAVGSGAFVVVPLARSSDGGLGASRPSP